MNIDNKDVIVYCGMDYGIDGRELGRVMYAYLDEKALQRRIDRDKNKAWRTIEKRIVNLHVIREQIIKRLDGVEKLALGIEEMPS
jgi:hypothetical protein